MSGAATAKRHGYTDFFVAVHDLRAAVAELRRLVKQPKEDALLAERRVRILTADESEVVAEITGDSGTYRTAIYRDGNLTIRECSCANGQVHPIACNCTHVRAVQKVWRMETAARATGQQSA